MNSNIIVDLIPLFIIVWFVYFTWVSFPTKIGQRRKEKIDREVTINFFSILILFTVGILIEMQNENKIIVKLVLASTAIQAGIKALVVNVTRMFYVKIHEKGKKPYYIETKNYSKLFNDIRYNENIEHEYFIAYGYVHKHKYDKFLKIYKREFSEV